MTDEEIAKLEAEIRDGRIEYQLLSDSIRDIGDVRRLRYLRRKQYDLRVWLNESVKRLQREEKKRETANTRNDIENVSNGTKMRVLPTET
jgi:hypothetical protein